MDDDHVDEFMRARSKRRHEKIGLKMDDEGEDEDEDEDEEDEEELEGDELDSFLDEEEDDDDDVDDEDDEDDDEDDGDGAHVRSKGGARARLRELEAQERLIREKLQRQAPEDEDDEGDTSDDEAAPPSWGRSKRAYYDNDEDEDGDEEDQKMEEEEALRMQREIASRLELKDFGLHDDGDFRRGRKAGPASKSEEEDEDEDEDEEDGDQSSSHKQLVALLGEMTSSLEDVRRFVPLIDAPSGGSSRPRSDKAGMSYLDAKYLLLMSYCTHIAFYLLLKAEGRSVEGHPVMDRLVEIRTYIERARPIDKKMRAQVDRLLEAVTKDAEGSGGGSLSLRPRPDALERQAGGGAARTSKKRAAAGKSSRAEDDEDDEDERSSSSDESEGGSDEEEGIDAGEGGLYRPPRVAPASMAGRGGRSAGANGSGARDRIRDFEDGGAIDAVDVAPEERQNIGNVGHSLVGHSEVRRLMRERLRAEEEAFVRLPVSAVEKKKTKAAERALGAGATLADFVDDLDAVADMRGRPADVAQARRGRRMNDAVGDAFAADAAAFGQRKRLRSGDEELPLAESLNERRIKYNSRKIAEAARAAVGGAGGSVAELDAPDHPEYERAAAAAEMKKARRAARNAVDGQTTAFAPVMQADVDGKRKINRTIEKNRGLTPHRKKLTKNPRKKHRMAYESALVRRKGQVQNVSSQERPYAGETTGVRTKVSKSRKL